MSKREEGLSRELVMPCDEQRLIEILEILGKSLFLVDVIKQGEGSYF